MPTTINDAPLSHDRWSTISITPVTPGTLEARYEFRDEGDTVTYSKWVVAFLLERKLMKVLDDGPIPTTQVVERIIPGVIFGLEVTAADEAIFGEYVELMVIS